MKFKLVKENKYKGILKTNILKGVLALGLVSTMLTSFAACTNADERKFEYNGSYITLSADKKDFSPIDFSDIDNIFNNYTYEFNYQEGSEISDPIYFSFYDHKNGGYDNEHPKTDGYVIEKIVAGKKVLVDASNHENILCSDYSVIRKPVSISTGETLNRFMEIENEQGAKRLVDAKDMSKVILDSYISISDEKLYIGFGFGDPPKYAREVILTSGEKILIDASDFTKILYRGYDTISSPYQNHYYSSEKGGVDTGEYTGVIREIITQDGTKKLVDVSDMSKVLISGYDCCSEPFYLEYYDSANGGKDNNQNGGNGYVWEFVIEGEKVLFDANDLSKELIRGYESLTSNQSGIIVTYSDGAVKVIKASEFPTSSEMETSQNENVEPEKTTLEEILTTTDVEDITTMPHIQTLENIEEERSYLWSKGSNIFNDKEYRIYLIKDSNFEVLVNTENFEEIIPSGRYIELITSVGNDFVYGITEDGRVDRINIDKKENIITDTILKNTNYEYGNCTICLGRTADNEKDYISYLELSSKDNLYNSAYINLITNKVEVDEGIYNNVDAFASNYYFLGMTPDGDLDAIKKGEDNSKVINIAKDTGYNTVSQAWDCADVLDEGSIFNRYIVLYNQEEGYESGKLYMITDNLELKQVEKNKVKVK